MTKVKTYFIEVECQLSDTTAEEYEIRDEIIDALQKLGYDMIDVNINDDDDEVSNEVNSDYKEDLEKGDLR